MIEKLANYDDELADLYLSEDFDAITETEIDRAVRAAVRSQKAVPLLCGSSLKNRGVQPLLDAIVKYLPSPDEAGVVKGHDKVSGKPILREPTKKEKFCALAFKVVNDKDKGPVTFFRVYSGMLKNR